MWSWHTRSCHRKCQAIGSSCKGQSFYGVFNMFEKGWRLRWQRRRISRRAAPCQDVRICWAQAGKMDTLPGMGVFFKSGCAKVRVAIIFCCTIKASKLANFVSNSFLWIFYFFSCKCWLLVIFLHFPSKIMTIFVSVKGDFLARWFSNWIHFFFCRSPNFFAIFFFFGTTTISVPSLNVFLVNFCSYVFCSLWLMEVLL